MGISTRLLMIGLLVLLALAPAGAGAKVKKKTVAKIWPSAAAFALDPAGVPQVAFQSIDHRPFHAALVGKKWLSEQVEDLSDAGWDPALGIDSAGRVHLAYHAERMLPSGGKLVYALFENGAWQIEEVDDGGWLTGLALDADDQAHLLYADLSGNLVHAQQEDVGWELHATGFSGGPRQTHLAVDTDGNVHACYVRNNGDITGADVWYATNAAGDWGEAVLGASGGHLCSLALDADGHPVVAVLGTQRISLFRSNGTGFDEEPIVDFLDELPGFTIGPDGIALALDAAGRAYLVVTLFVTDGVRGTEGQLFLANDGEEWRVALLGSKDEGYEPSLAVAHDGSLQGIWRSGGADRAKLYHFLATFPDLSGSWSGIALGGGVVSGTLQVVNEGTDKSKSAPVAVYLSDDAALDPGDTLLSARRKVGSVKPGTLRSVEIELDAAAATSGQYLIAVIDPEKQLDDLDRLDNTVAAPIP